MNFVDQVFNLNNIVEMRDPANNISQVITEIDKSLIPTSVTLQCPAKGCNIVFTKLTYKVARKSLMRHLHDQRKRAEKRCSFIGDEILRKEFYANLIAAEPNPEKQVQLQQRLEKEVAHSDGWWGEHENARTTLEKQKASKKRWRDNNHEKVNRISRMGNYRARAKKIPEIATGGAVEIEKFVQECEEKFQQKKKEKEAKGQRKLKGKANAGCPAA